MVKAKPVVDVEASEKNTIKNSPLGKFMLSDKKCPHCGVNALDGWAGECIKCGKALNEPPKKPEPPAQPVQPPVQEPPKEEPKKEEPAKKPVAKSAGKKKAEAEEPAEAEESAGEESDEAAAPKYLCKKCNNPVDAEDEKCPKCGCREAYEAD